jgi:hypothetical protein
MKNHDWSTANALNFKDLGVGITDLRLAQDLERERVRHRDTEGQEGTKECQPPPQERSGRR